MQSALELPPGIAEAHNNLALALLAKGRLQEGWPEYEWRKASIELAKTISQPRWTGSPLEGRTILLVAEQGLGDTLQFIRYAQLVKQCGATVVVECQPQLVGLVATSPASIACLRPVNPGAISTSTVRC